MIAEKIPKIPKIFECEMCEYSTCNKKDYKKHLSTSKHKMVINGNKMVIEKSQNPQHNFDCICGKSYKHNSGLKLHSNRYCFFR